MNEFCRSTNPWTLTSLMLNKEYIPLHRHVYYQFLCINIFIYIYKCFFLAFLVLFLKLYFFTKVNFKVKKLSDQGDKNFWWLHFCLQKWIFVLQKWNNYIILISNTLKNLGWSNLPKCAFFKKCGPKCGFNVSQRGPIQIVLILYIKL